MIGIIDYGMGNLSSVYKAVRFLGYDAVISEDEKELNSCSGLILPGVGAFSDAMRNLRDIGLIEPIEQYVKSGRPFLGICLGLQLLFEGSDEGEGKGLCLLDGMVRELPPEIELKIPHMGWNYLKDIKENRIFKNTEEKPYVYFVHSYYIEPVNRDVIIASVNYGFDFGAAVNKDNIWAFQFHPEKSGDVGLGMLRNWLEITSEERLK